ncbi:MAG TPA: aminotransferase class V-fold PLP-dependent enzyme, partial [Candidatus Paceibacterota bacterium]|nr:aminotransferase class V-fold PLP-dependent enzyme [Candidatus Paceibacterota bacterium]
MKYKDYIYLDYAATTPLDTRVEEAFLPYLEDKFGNPGSLHKPGQDAITAVDDARQKIADILNVDFHEVIFTGSATEANNLILRGTVKKAVSEGVKKPKLIISSIEHPSVLNTAQDLEKEGVEVKYLKVDKDGFVDPHKLKEELNSRTVLVSVMYANNEIGTIQPVQKIAEIVKNFRDSETTFPVFHTDAVQAFQYCSSDFEFDAMTLSAHKIYGPKGIGLLIN